MTQPVSVTDNIPGTTGSYNYHWKTTLERVNKLYETLTQDSLPAPVIGEDGTPLTPEQLADNPKWFFTSFLTNIIEELRLTRAEVRAATGADEARDLAMLREVRAVMMDQAPALAEYISSRIEAVDPEALRPVVEAGVREVLWAGVDEAPPGPEPTG